MDHGSGGSKPQADSKIMLIYQFIFYSFYRFFTVVAFDSFGVWKSLGFILVLQVLIIFVGVLEICWLMKWPFPYQHFVLYMLAPIAALIPLNSHTFEYNGRWKRYAERFDSYSAKTRLLGYGGVFLLVVSILWSLFLVLSQMKPVGR